MGGTNTLETSQKSKSVFAIWISLVANIVLTFLKIIVGFLYSSQVLIADGIHNAGDIIASVAALGATSVSKKPADEDHPYGHGKAEVIAAAIVAIILIIAAIFMGYSSFSALFEPAVKASMIGLTAAIISLVVKQLLYGYCMRLGKKENSKSLIATAYDHLADVYSSIAAVIGIGLALIGDHYNIAILRYGDPVAGIVVSFFVLKLAVEIGKEAIDVLMETTVPAEQLEKYTNVVQLIPEVKRIDRIRAREHGHYVIVDIRVGIPGYYTIQQGHDISRHIKQNIMDAYQEVDEVLVHLNPWYEDEER
ncbi:cation diffusion facilitator family transporter [Brevibacillus ginsengisoli]|uniref:cation diffusion facilitator family transporter n=1 Tax=Brevibacillus ginsengisoli TaxID=363854 RepID=UPI003CF72036